MTFNYNIHKQCELMQFRGSPLPQMEQTLKIHQGQQKTAALVNSDTFAAYVFLSFLFVLFVRQYKKQFIFIECTHDEDCVCADLKKTPHCYYDRHSHDRQCYCRTPRTFYQNLFVSHCNQSEPLIGVQRCVQFTSILQHNNVHNALAMRILRYL